MQSVCDHGDRRTLFQSHGRGRSLSANLVAQNREEISRSVAHRRKKICHDRKKLLVRRGPRQKPELGAAVVPPEGRIDAMLVPDGIAAIAEPPDLLVRHWKGWELAQPLKHGIPMEEFDILRSLDSVERTRMEPVSPVR